LPGEELESGAHPPNTGLFSPAPAAGGGDYDAWGNIKKNPAKAEKERHNEDFINIFLYQLQDNWYYGYQLKIDKLARQKKANISDPAFGSPGGARREAIKTIIRLCRENRAIKRLFAEFAIAEYNQLELFKEAIQ
jgi:hypothetical protein